MGTDAWITASGPGHRGDGDGEGDKAGGEDEEVELRVGLSTVHT